MTRIAFPSRKFLRRLALLCAGGAGLALTQCRSVQSYEEIEYDPATLETPSGHGMEKKDYPFDDDGDYRKTWVRNETSGRTRSSYDQPEPASETESGGGGTVAAAPVGEEAPAGYADLTGGTSTEETPGAASGTVSATMPEGESSSESGATASPEPRYHEVAPGDTLYSLAQRYDTTVEDLKRINGLTSNAIRTGQSLRVP